MNSSNDRKSMMASGRQKVKQAVSIIRRKPRVVTIQDFKYVYQNKIGNNLQTKGKMLFEEVNVMLAAYEFYRYEMASQKTLKKIVAAENQGKTAS